MVDSRWPGAGGRATAPPRSEPADICGPGPEREMRRETTMTAPVTSAARGGYLAAATGGTDPIEAPRRSAWVPVMQGTISIAFGAGALVAPGADLAVLVALFGGY